jgi:hypothetical protein
MSQAIRLAAEPRRGTGDAPPRLAVRESGIYGMGCFALTHLPARKMIAHYGGETVRGSRRIEARLRQQQAIKVIRLKHDLAIDGAVGGNETAYINHSCEPNAFMRVCYGRVEFYTLRPVEAGEELTCDYGETHHDGALACRCGSAKCKGRL